MYNYYVILLRKKIKYKISMKIDFFFGKKKRNYIYLTSPFIINLSFDLHTIFLKIIFYNIV